MSADRYAVFGNPVAHSLSPRIHEAFARQLGHDLTYERIEAPLDGFGASAEAFIAAGGRGFNVTVPFKGDAFAWVDERDPLASEAQAVNTVICREGSRRGFNTDGLGLVADLGAHGVALNGARVLLVGAGGASRGVVGPLLRAGVARLVIANRTRDRALQLCRTFDTGEDRVAGTGLELDDLAMAERRFDLVINATSAGLAGEAAGVPGEVATGAVCYDMVYSLDGDTAFCEWAQRHAAARAIDGLGMLVEQAAEAFLLWRGVRPDARAVLDSLRGTR